MPVRKPREQFDQRAIRNWTLYVVKFEGGYYYVGITSRKNFMRRINQHGGRTGARVSRGKILKEIVEIQHLGKMTGYEAGRIENEMTLQYRKKLGVLGFLRVRGGFDIHGSPSIVPTYTPGSVQFFIFLINCVLLIALLLVIITKR